MVKPVGICWSWKRRTSPDELMENVNSSRYYQKKEAGEVPQIHVIKTS
jgi:hypothetical protein